MGRRIAFNSRPGENEEWLTIIGVAGDVVQNNLDEMRRRGAMYLSDQQSGAVLWRWVVRSAADPAVATEQARNVFRRLDPEMSAFWNITMEGAISERLIPRRIPMLLVLGFAGVALMLTTLGIYGVLAYAAGQRTHEFGIRIALGSSVGSIYKLMLRELPARFVTR